MIVLGLILALVGYLLPVPVIIGHIGLALLLIGVVLTLLGSTGHAVGGRNTWY